MSSQSLISVLAPYFLRHKWPYLLGIILIVLTNLLANTVWWLVKLAIDSFSQKGDIRLLGIYAGMIVIVAVSQAAIRIVSRMAIFYSGREIETDIRSTLFQKLQSLPPSYYQSRSTGDLMSRATNDVTSVRLVLGPVILNLVNTTVVYAATLPLVFLISPKLTLYALLPYPLFLLLAKGVSRAMYQRSHTVQETLGEMTGSLREGLTGIHVVKAYGQEDRQYQEFADISAQYLRANLHLIKIQGLLFSLMGAIGGIGTLIVLWLGGGQVIEQTISYGGFVAFFGYLARLTFPTLALGWMISLFQRGKAAMDRVQEVLQVKPALADRPGLVPLSSPYSMKGEVEFRNLRFRYNGSWVLQDVNLKVSPGFFVAVVGRTGAGKSSLLNLIPHLYEVGDGQLFIDGVDINRIPLKDLRTMVGVVPQETFLFSTSIAENICFADPDTSPEEAEHYLKIACLDQEVHDFPRGLETLVGERGITLSGGQRARVALARALVKKPRFLVLDAPFSHVDLQTEGAILENIRPLFQGITTFLVTHRPSIIQSADLIVVVDQGRVAETGTHETLLQQGGLYTEIYRESLLAMEIEQM